MGQSTLFITLINFVHLKIHKLLHILKLKENQLSEVKLHLDESTTPHLTVQLSEFKMLLRRIFLSILHKLARFSHPQSFAKVVVKYVVPVSKKCIMTKRS